MKKELADVVSCDYSDPVKTKFTSQTKYPAPKSEPMMLREVAVAPGIGEVINLRSAKTHLSALLELVARGRDITITSDGKPKARLTSVTQATRQKAFQGMGDFLLKQPIHTGVSAEEVIREDRDSRGW